MENFKNISRIMLISILSFLYFETIAQEDGLFKHTLYDSRSNQVMKVLEKTGDSYTLREGPYTGYPTKDHFYTINFPGGGNKILEKNEIVEGIADGNMITMRYDLFENKTTVSSNIILENNIALKNQLSFDGQLQVSVFNTGTIIISDLYELYGTQFKIYDKDLQLLNTISPFEEGFQSVRFTFLIDKLIAIVQQAESPYEDKYIEIDPINGSIFFQTKLEEKNSDIVNIVTSGNRIIIVEPTKIIVIKQGVIQWVKDISLFNYDIITNVAQNAIYYCLSDKIIKISADDGKVLFTKKFTDLYPPSTNLNNQMISPIIFRTLPDNKTLLILTEVTKGSSIETSYKNNPKLYILDKHGNFMENPKIRLSPFHWVELIEKDNNKVSVITDNQQIEL